MTSILLQLQSVTRSFRQGDSTVDVLKGIDLEIKPGEIVALMGQSGADYYHNGAQ